MEKTSNCHLSPVPCLTINAQQGNALLITMIVITVVASVAIVAAKLSLSTFRQTVRLDNAANAYLAASTGLEDSLLRWKFDRNSQAPLVSATSNCSTPPSDGSAYYDRFNLTQNSVSQCLNPENNAPSLTDIVYDLKLFHGLQPSQKECVGSAPSTYLTEGLDSCITLTQNQSAIDQDQSVEYDTTDLKGSLSISWGFNSTQSICGNSCDWLEIISLSCPAEIGNICNRAIFNVADGSVCNSSTRICTVSSFDTKTGINLRLKALGSAIDWYVIGSNDATDSLDSRFTQVDAIGYFSGVKRRLRLKLDRLTGAALPIYDYALFAGSGDVTTTP